MLCGCTCGGANETEVGVADDALLVTIRSEDVAAALKRDGLVDDKGLLKEDPRKRTWVSPLRQAIAERSDDTLEADESCISERMNVAYAFHEFTAEYARAMFDFCEEAGRFAPGGMGYRHHAATIFGAGGAGA